MLILSWSTKFNSQTHTFNIILLHLASSYLGAFLLNNFYYDNFLHKFMFTYFLTNLRALSHSLSLSDFLSDKCTQVIIVTQDIIVWAWLFVHKHKCNTSFVFIYLFLVDDSCCCCFTFIYNAKCYLLLLFFWKQKCCMMNNICNVCERERERPNILLLLLQLFHYILCPLSYRIIVWNEMSMKYVITLLRWW